MWRKTRRSTRAHRKRCRDASWSNPPNSQTALRVRRRRLCRRFRCAKSLFASRVMTPGTTPGFLRDFMDRYLTFGSFRFEPGTARLWESGTEVKLTRKAAMVLGALLERPGTPVSKQDLFANVWRGTVVSDDALVTCIQEIRKALGDDSKQSRYIETRHRLGYRFAAA